MRNVGAIAACVLVAISVAVACSGDEAKKQAREDAGGNGGAAVGGSPVIDQAGGQQRPEPEGGAGGEAGQVTGAAGHGGHANGGAPDVDANGGTGAPSPQEEGGSAGAGPQCGAQAGKFTYKCGEVEAWKPVFVTGLGAHFELDVSSLPYQVDHGEVTYFYSNADGEQCGIASVTVTGHTVKTEGNFIFPPTKVRISTFTLIDVCGNEHSYDPLGTVCNELQGSGSFGTVPLTCVEVGAGNCPAQCT